MNRLATIAILTAILGIPSADLASAATCCISSSETCPAPSCTPPNVNGDCYRAAQPMDCGAPYYCPFDPDRGCSTTTQCSAAKLKASGKAARAALRCDAKADAQGVAVDEACTSKALDPLPGAFSEADALGPCPGNAATVQNQINTLQGNANTAVGNADMPRTRSRCDSRKIKAAAREAAHLHGCESEGASKAINIFPCRLSADSSFNRTVVRINRRGVDCSNRDPSEQSDLEYEAVYPYVTAVVDHLGSPNGAFLN